jgi:hypothetical protein
MIGGGGSVPEAMARSSSRPLSSETAELRDRCKGRRRVNPGVGALTYGPGPLRLLYGLRHVQSLSPLAESVNKT